MTTFHLWRPQHCQYAIHGDVYVRKRGGSFWEPEDELARHVRQNGTGVVLVDCETEESASRVRQLLDAHGFIAGVDYGVYSVQGTVTVCPGIQVEHWTGMEVEASGTHDWRLPPMPKAMAERRRAEFEASEAERFRFFSRVMRVTGTDPAVIEAAAAKGTPSEQIRALLYPQAPR